MSTYFIGTVFRTVAGWQEVAITPTAPSNYKKPEKIVEYITQALNDQQYEAMLSPLTGALARVCVLDEKQETIYSSSDGDQQVGMAFMSWLLSKFPTHFGDALRDDDAYPSDILIGFGIKRALKVAAFEVLQYNKSLPLGAKLNVPVRLWHNPIGVYDPEDILVKTKDAKVIDLMTIMRELGVVVPEAFSFDARVNAFTCGDIAKAAQLVPAYSGAVVQ